MTTIPAIYSTKRFGGQWTRTSCLAFSCLFLLLSSAGPAHGADAGPISEENVEQRIAAAKSAADHEALAAYYLYQATEKAAQEIKHQQAIINSYKEATLEGPGGASQARIREWMRKHCRGLIESYRRIQENYLSLAGEHTRLARKLSPQE